VSTEKMDDNQGTAKMEAGTAKMDGNKGGVATSAGVVFVSGQTIVLNGRNCVIDGVISGSTGEAVVYKVIIDGKPYALKHYKPNTPLSDTAKKVIAKIKDNPRDRIIKIYDFGSYNEQDYEIMEYAEGGTLDQYLKSNGAIHDTTKIKNIVNMITEGLEQLHGYYRIIYQDLKPENIYFKDTNKTSIVLADFGISSVMQGYDEEVEVTASVTDLYAAPELRHKANRKEVMATPSVDYFSLGITMLELWLGEKPFKGVRDAKRDSLIDDEEVDLPIDMPNDYATIIQGLIKPKRKDRWGNEQVRKWLKGEALTINSNVSKKVSTVYDPLKFSESEYASNPKELAALMDKYPDMGKSFLYDDFITGWLKKAGDVMLFNKIQKITSQYTKDKEAGLYSAILALDPETPFKSRSGKVCKTTDDIADAIMAESAYYMEDLKKSTANLYLYLETAEGSRGKEAADIFCKNFKEFSPKRALALVYLKLQSDGGITIGSKHYQSPDELKHEKDDAQIALIKKAVTEKDSMLLVWLADTYGGNLKSTDIFNKLHILEQFFLLGLMPFLSFKELNGNSRVLQDLIDSYPGRSDLFEIYAAQGLPLTGQDYGDKRTPIDYAVCNFNELSGIHGTDTIRNMIRLLCKLGADVNEYSNDGTYPLINAYDAKNDDLVKLLLELGAGISYKSHDGKICETSKDIADAIMAESAFYMKDLKNPKAILYLHLAATEGSQGKEAVDAFCKYFKEYSPKRALALVYIKLQSDGGITIGAKHYQSPEELKYEKDSAQIDLIKKAVTEKDSLLLVWLSDMYGDNLESTDGFSNLNVLEQFFLLGLMPFLSFKEYNFDNLDVLRYFINSYPERADLFEIYAAQGLPLTGENDDKINPIDYVVCNFYELNRRHGTDTVYNLIRLLCKLGADLNEHSSNGTYPLINAHDAKNEDLVNLLLELGADSDQLRKTIEQREEQERIERERKAEQERQKIQEAEDRKRREAKAERKKKLKSLTGILAAVIAVVALVKFINYRLTESFFNFEQNDQGTLTITGYSGKKQVVIPVTNNEGIPITEINDKAFYYKKLTSVVIPNGITKIGDEAFYGNQLTDIVIPDSVITIGKNAFSGNMKNDNVPTGKGNKLTSLTIGNGVTSIESGIFAGNQLTDIVIPDNVITIGDRAFADNILTNVVIGNGVTTIGNNAFANNQLTDIVIPKSVITIGDSAFSGNILTNVVIGNGVTAIGNNAFANNKLTDIVIPKSVITIGDSAFSDNILTNAVIGNGVTAIGNNAFANNQLTNVVIPKSVITIGDRAFADNILTSVVVGNGVTAIGSNAFANNKLTKIVIPNSVITIGDRAFADNKLTNVAVPKSVKSIGNDVFSTLEILTVTEIKDKEFYKKKLTSVVIPDGITKIGNEAFYGNRLTDVVIPDSVITIGDRAFADNKLTNVVIGNGVTTIGSNAFANNKLTDVIIPKSVITIGDRAFAGNKLTNVVVPKSVKSIGYDVFSTLENLPADKSNNVGKWWTTSDFWSVFINICLFIVYLIILYGTDIVRGGRRFLPLIIFSLIIGICVRSFNNVYGSVLGFFIMIATILIQSITICVWEGNVGILLIYLIWRIIYTTLCTIPFWLLFPK